MSSGGAVTYNYDFPSGNTVLLSVTIQDFSGNTVLVSNVSSISLSIYAPFVAPFGSTAPLTTITPSGINTTTWQAYYTPALGSALGTYTVGVQATTVSGLQLTDYFKFRIIDVDA